MPYIPRLLAVKVPPSTSAMVSSPFLARSVSAVIATDNSSTESVSALCTIEQTTHFGANVTREYNWKTGCAVEATLSVIGGRWKPILICRLLDGRKRFGELCRLAPNATQRMITLLEADGIISRHVFPEVPPRVEYEITDYGRTLAPIIKSMQKWGKTFKEQQLAGEEACDNNVPAQKSRSKKIAGSGAARASM
jgi:DNA-binding HxlR family transcriptional regulator